MKFIKNILIGFIVTASLMSCVDYLDKETDTELTLPLVFEDKTRIEGWLANVYSAIPDPYWGYTNTLGWEVLADDLTPSERWRQWGGKSFLIYWVNGHLTVIGKEITGSFFRNVFGRLIFSLRTYTHYQHRV